MQINIAVEGLTDDAAIRRICRDCGLEIAESPALGGKSELDKRLEDYNAAAHHSPWLVVRDLNSDADCAPLLLRDILPDPAPKMMIRIVVRELEAWLMGDATSFAKYFRIPVKRIPSNPERIRQPKQHFLDLVRHSPSSEIRKDILPARNSRTAVGPGYSDRIIEYIYQKWRPDVAKSRCDSLQRCMRRLALLAGRGSERVP